MMLWCCSGGQEAATYCASSLTREVMAVMLNRGIGSRGGSTSVGRRSWVVDKVEGGF